MLGHHFLIDLKNCNIEKINDPIYIEATLRRIATDSGSSVIAVAGHKFTPQGVTVVLIVSASHFSFHSWPEHAFASVDLFVCNKSLNTNDWEAILKENFECEISYRLVVERGSELFDKDTYSVDHGTGGNL